MKPSIRFVGRVPGDALNQLETEIHLVDGSGNQTNYGRWGDYSAMQVDPSDDKTFYYTTEYLQTDGVFNWSTAISKVRFTRCP